jgi:Zn-dependent M28 family amino/carboxypeptidase
MGLPRTLAPLLRFVCFWLAAGPLIQVSACAAETSARTIKQAIDADRFRAAIVELTSPELNGRAVGTPGGAAAISYVEAEFKAIGLLPGFRGAFRQDYVHEFKGTANAANVIGVIEGSDPELKHEIIVISAHRDHLGRRLDYACPNDPETKDCVKYGADDNASGTAALFELARAFLAVRSELKRTLVFLSTDGEECGCTGVKQYVYRDPPFPLHDTIYNLNIDEIGQGGSLETHELNLNQPESRDCLVDAEVFANRGIAAQSFVGDSGENYHQCSDTLQNMNVDASLDTVRLAVNLIWDRAQAPSD